VIAAAFTGLLPAPVHDYVVVIEPIRFLVLA